MHARRFQQLAVTMLLVTLSGCATGPLVAEVEGTVTLDGKPLPGVQVVFAPEVSKEEDGRTSSAVTDDQGRFVLSLVDAKQARPGAIVGKHKVVLQDYTWENARDDPKRGVRRIPDQYSKFGTTPLSVTVEPGKNTLPLTVKR
jgi:hypothetical protein